MKKNIIIGIVLILCAAGYVFGFTGLEGFANGSVPSYRLIIGFASLFIAAITLIFLRGLTQKITGSLVFVSFMYYLFTFIKALQILV